MKRQLNIMVGLMIAVLVVTGIVYAESLATVSTTSSSSSGSSSSASSSSGGQDTTMPQESPGQLPEKTQEDKGSEADPIIVTPVGQTTTSAASGQEEGKEESVSAKPAVTQETNAPLEVGTPPGDKPTFPPKPKERTEEEESMLRTCIFWCRNNNLDWLRSKDGYARFTACLKECGLDDAEVASICYQTMFPVVGQDPLHPDTAPQQAEAASPASPSLGEGLKNERSRLAVAAIAADIKADVGEDITLENIDDLAVRMGKIQENIDSAGEKAQITYDTEKSRVEFSRWNGLIKRIAVLDLNTGKTEEHAKLFGFIPLPSSRESQ